jgi:hypothetical protein
MPHLIRRLPALVAVVISALGLLAPISAQATKGKKYALLVGVREYDHAKLPDLKYRERC